MILCYIQSALLISLALASSHQPTLCKKRPTSLYKSTTTSCTTTAKHYTRISPPKTKVYVRSVKTATTTIKPYTSSTVSHAPTTIVKVPSISSSSTTTTKTTTTTSNPSPTAAPVISDGFQQCLNLHNQARQEVGHRPLTWSLSLQQSATNAAADMVRIDPSGNTLHHSQTPNVGENLYSNRNPGTAATCAEATAFWVDEKRFYTRGQPIGSGDFAAYGHYTQIVYKDVKMVGCNDRTGVYVVCHYDQIQMGGVAAY